MNEYQEKLKRKMDEFVHLVYKITRRFPREELYGATSQLRRAVLSIILNYIEGFARGRMLIQLNFKEIAFGSLKEARYLLDFSLAERYLNNGDYDTGIKLADEIGAMLWSEIQSIKKSKNQEIKKT